MKVFNGLDALKQAQGEHLGYSDWITVTQDAIDRFADLTGDRQWIHTDVVRAAAGPFGGTIAHGYLTLSLISQLLWQVYRLDGFSMEMNYGLNRVRFPSVLPAGSRVRAGVELLEITSSGRGSTAVLRVQLDIEGSVRPACVAEILVLLRP